jgi:alpha-tubulin suppressor-like RCC1 family protein
MSGDGGASDGGAASDDGGSGDATSMGPDAEAGPGGGSDATVVDAAGDGPGQTAEDGCIVAIFGDHYLRADGKLLYQTSGVHTFIVSAASPTVPLVGITEVTQQQTDHACGLRASDGTVWCWPTSANGTNPNGELGNGSLVVSNAALGVATQVVTNAADAGSPVYLEGVVHLSSGPSDYGGYNDTTPTCAIKSDKSVWCWGKSTAQGASNDGLFWGTTGSVAAVPYAIKMVGAAGPAAMMADRVAVGSRHACLLLNGKVSCWGQNIAGNLADGDGTLAYKPYPVPIVTAYGLPATVDAIGSGSDYSCAMGGGKVWCWGQTNAGQIGNPSVAPVACGGQLCDPQPTPVQASAPDGGTTQVADGGPDQKPLVGVTSLAVGVTFACALDGSGSIWCWGNEQGAVQILPLATPVMSATLPYTGVTQITVSGLGLSYGLLYLTPTAYVQGKNLATPYCQ